jgi:hypothetical protein
MAIPLKIYVAYFARSKHAVREKELFFLRPLMPLRACVRSCLIERLWQVAVSASSSVSDGLLNQQQQQQYAAPHNYSMPPPQQYVHSTSSIIALKSFFFPTLTLFPNTEILPSPLQLMCRLPPLPTLEPSPLRAMLQLL